MNFRFWKYMITAENDILGLNCFLMLDALIEGEGVKSVALGRMGI